MMVQRPPMSQPAEYHVEPSSSSSLFPSLPPAPIPSSAPVQPNFGVPDAATQALPVYKLQTQDSGDHVFPTCSDSVFPNCPSFSTYNPNDVDEYGFSKPPPIPDYGEVVPNPYIQQEIDRSMVPLSVNSDPYEQPRLCQMIGVQNSPAMPITHSASLPQYTPPPHTQSVPQIVPESGINGVFRSVSRAFTRLNRKVTKPSSPQNPPCPYPNASAPAPQYAAYPIGPVSPTQSVPPPYSSYPSPPQPVQYQPAVPQPQYRSVAPPQAPQVPMAPMTPQVPQVPQVPQPQYSTPIPAMAPQPPYSVPQPPMTPQVPNPQYSAPMTPMAPQPQYSAPGVPCANVRMDGDGDA